MAKKAGIRLLITTHSPYILSALNNYIYASEVHAKHGRGIDEIDVGLFLDINDIKGQNKGLAEIYQILKESKRFMVVSE